MYHLGDGIYGAFSCLLFDSLCPTPRLHKVRAWPSLGSPHWLLPTVLLSLNLSCFVFHHGWPQAPCQRMAEAMGKRLWLCPCEL